MADNVRKRTNMKIAVMADIHSNVEAFKTCIAEAERRGVTEYIFLGDYLGDMANPQETLQQMDLIKNNYPCTFIRGNKEEYWINHRRNPKEIWKTGTTTTGMLEYNYSHLSSGDIDFFEDMPISKEMHYEGFPVFTVCHGSPFRVNQSMRPDYDYIDELVDQLESQMVICAHFHIQTEYERKGKVIINPGAVGVSLHSKGRTQFMMLTGENGCWQHEFITLPYDTEKTLKSMDEEKLFLKAPGWYEITKHLLITGETPHAMVVRQVMDRYYKDTGKKTLHDIPEEYWKAAIEKLGDCK